MGYRVAVVGATGNVGREMLNILEEVNFPVEKIHAIASRKSIGVEVSFGEKIVKCEDVETFDFSTVDLVLMSVRSGRLAALLRERFRAALIDEFQDTDPVQYDIFRRIYADSGLPVFLVGGLAVQIGLQAVINMAVNVHLLPSKGMTLPFISYGGSSLIALSIGFGLLLAFTRRNPFKDRSPYVVRWKASE